MVELSRLVCHEMMNSVWLSYHDVYSKLTRGPTSHEVLRMISIGRLLMVFGLQRSRAMVIPVHFRYILM